jgi:hypothetical protein
MPPPGSHVAAANDSTHRTRSHRARKSGAAKKDLLSTPNTIVGYPRDARIAPSDDSATSYDSAAPDDGAATINSATIVAAAILIVRIAIAARIISPATGHDCTPSHDRSASINGTAPNCSASAHPDSAAAPVTDLHNPTVVA